MAQLKNCPNCNSPSLAKILYGMPNYDDDLNDDLQSGKVVLGGCSETDNDPDLHCLVCRAFLYSKTGRFEFRDDEELS